jgi:hypothetical protein
MPTEWLKSYFTKMVEHGATLVVPTEKSFVFDYLLYAATYGSLIAHVK